MASLGSKELRAISCRMCIGYRNENRFLLSLVNNTFPSPLIACCRYRERRDFPFDSNTFLSPLIDCCRYRERRDFPFDNMFWALLTLFEVLTLEGWLDVRDMLKTDGDWPDSATAWVCTCTHMYVGAGYCTWINIRIAVFSPGFFNRRARADHQVSSPIKRGSAWCTRAYAPVQRRYQQFSLVSQRTPLWLQQVQP